ncbi:MAG: DUF177 domain-containing protein [Acidobacteria bacterium]|jgi:uncharacterized protein|nr:DUF177 domain-containing protein [Acidobacteriota bacterium]
MIIDLTATEKTPVSFDFLLPPDAVNSEDEAIKLLEAARVRGALTKRAAGVNVKGEISARADLECSRCLRSIEQVLEFPFAAAFVEPENYTRAKDAELRGDDLEVSVLDSHRIDLSELAREQILLAAPSQIFCAGECKGLCQKCGANRNLVDCDCEQKEVDPRWAALKNLK